MNPKGVQDTLSFAAVFIRLHFNEQFLSSASAFLWRYDNKAYLISNWHNLTGREPDTRKPKSDTAGIPNRVECYLYTNKLSNGTIIPGYRWESVFFPLTKSETLEPLFLEHKACSADVDLAALPIELPEQIVPFYLNEQPFEDELRFYPGQDAFIVGYPLGAIAGNTLPIWKRATISSEPYVPIGGLKKILVDTASRPGMSGSFVLAQHTGIFNPTSGKSMAPDSWIGSGRKILGVYSGRIGPSDLEAQLGIVWSRDYIDEIVAQGVPPII